MKLRRWQQEAVSAALTKYRSNQSHFLCLATPGSGKTFMASTIAKRLLQSNKIDLVFCFTPSVIVASSFKATLESVLTARIDGQLGSVGSVLTYQSMLNLNQSFWSLLDSHRTLVIFDEIHHCAGDHLGNANAWGQKVLQKIQGRATYTLALSGTPWRSDRIPIVLSSYCREGKIHCDYKYGLGQAIEDGVCRIPKITAIDNGCIVFKTAAKEDHYQSFGELLQSSNCTYLQLLDNTTLIDYFVILGISKLRDIRRNSPDAGGLVVAASVAHAQRIAHVFKEHGELPIIVTYTHDNPQDIIQHFRYSDAKWIISVGMISEGTDIPRLRVCCHLSRVKTELYFRQVLGLILRVQQRADEEAYFLMPAEPDLIGYAERASEDVPISDIVSVTDMSENSELGELQRESDGEIPINLRERFGLVIAEDIDSNQSSNIKLSGPNCGTSHFDNSLSSLSETYEATIDLFGRFKTRMIHMSLL